MRLSRAAFLLGGTVATACSAAPPQPTNVEVGAHCETDGRLKSITIGANEVGRLGASDAIDRLKGAVGDPGLPLHILNLMDTPYRCLGGAIFMLQRAGARKIGFVSEQPQESGKP